jgi:hypothetical protein
MSEITVSMSGIGDFTMSLDIHDPATIDDPTQTEVWRATFCDPSTGDCDIVYFEMSGDYDTWDILDEAIQTYRLEV